ncbi:MAG: WYL domain-containing protein [Anaerolineales bacterium]|nr:WYL domain-containing protein [Anaerolineales bacterium]
MTEFPHLFYDQPVAVVDVETTGLSALYGDRICEVGIVCAQGDQILDTYQSLVNPQRLISPGAARVNGLSDAEVCQAPLFAEIASQVLERINGAVLVCHNAPFDLGFLDAELARLRLPWQPAGVIDTLEIARRCYHFSSNGLSRVAARLRIETPQAHRALGDALTTFQVFRHFYHDLTGSTTFQEQELVSEHHPATFRLEVLNLPPELQEALAGNESIVITYVDAKGAETDRMITPLSIRAANDYIYLFAYCHLRQAERSFRLDRIIEIGRID